MCRRLAYLIAASLVLMAGAGVQGAVWTVDFDTPHDFLADGVEGTGWDGFIGSGPDETADAINSSMDRPGQLYLQSGNGGRWEPDFTPKGPFLYKVVEGDFIATVQVTDFPGMPGSASPVAYWADSFIMARVANLDDAGAGEDLVCTHYFPTATNYGNLRRTIDNGAESEGPGTGDGFNCGTYLQLERQGNSFFCRRSFDGEAWEDIGEPIARDDMDGLPLQVGLAQCMYVATTGFVAFDNFHLEGPNVSPPGEAYNADPGNGATDVPREKVLAWTAAEAAVSHDVYFGTVLEDVDAASRTAPLGVLVSEGQVATSYDPPSRLELGQTYYWRVDEVEADGTIRAGHLWQFTVEPPYYPIEGVAATASSFDAISGPEQTVNGSGLDADDEHSDQNAHMWLVPQGETEPIWIQYEFDRVYKLYEMWVWNANVQYELFLNFSVKDVTIEYSVDGNDWTVLGDYVFNKGTGLVGYAHNTTIDLEGVPAQYVRINVNSNYGGARTGLSEVRFFQKPCSAKEPQPASGATEVSPDVVLTWRAGREAAMHEVQFDANEQAVADGAALADTVAQNSYAPAALELGSTYYWRIDEVNDAETPASWPGEVWSLSTPEYLAVEDFESYNEEEGNEVYNTWLDGYDVDENGSQAGHDDAPYVEQSIVHGGRQSLPMSYDNTAGVTMSEVERTFGAPQDWTKAGATTLVLFVRGSLGNAPGQLYVEINGTRMEYGGNPASLAAPVWKQWNIDLATPGVGASSVRSMVIGVSGSGTGLIYLDDIRLYRSAAPMAGPPVDPGVANLVASYAMEDNLVDGSGNGRDGTAAPGTSFGQGPVGYGRAVVLDGTSGYIDLPIGPLMPSLNSATVTAWVNRSATGAWQRIFDFGTGTDVYMFLTPTGNGTMRFIITTSGVSGESVVAASNSLPVGGWHHVAAAIDGTTGEVQLYLDGVLVGSGPTSAVPADLGNTTQNWIGRSQYDVDPYLNGSVDDFRIYDRALSDPEIRYIVGDR